MVHLDSLMKRRRKQGKEELKSKKESRRWVQLGLEERSPRRTQMGRTSFRGLCRSPNVASDCCGRKGLRTTC